MIFVAPRTMLSDALRGVLLAALMMLALLGSFPVAGQVQFEGEYGLWVTDSGGGSWVWGGCYPDAGRESWRFSPKVVSSTRWRVSLNAPPEPF